MDVITMMVMVIDTEIEMVSYNVTVILLYSVITLVKV